LQEELHKDLDFKAIFKADEGQRVFHI